MAEKQPAKRATKKQADPPASAELLAEHGVPTDCVEAYEALEFQSAVDEAEAEAEGDGSGRPLRPYDPEAPEQEDGPADG